MTAFDNPPISDPGTTDHLWIAHNRAEANRVFRTYHIADYSGYTGDNRKAYLANVGPMVCGFAVYQDFDHYGGRRLSPRNRKFSRRATPSWWWVTRIRSSVDLP